MKPPSKHAVEAARRIDQYAVLEYQPHRHEDKIDYLQSVVQDAIDAAMKDPPTGPEPRSE